MLVLGMLDRRIPDMSDCHVFVLVRGYRKSHADIKGIIDLNNYLHSGGAKANALYFWLHTVCLHGLRALTIARSHYPPLAGFLFME